MITQIPLQNTRGLLETQPWKSSPACCLAECCSAERSSHCPWAGRKEASLSRLGKTLGHCLLGAVSHLKVSYLAEGAIHNKDPIQHHCCSSSNILFEKLISHEIYTLVSLSLTVLRNCVKSPEAPFHHWKPLSLRMRHSPACKYIWRNKAILAKLERKKRNCR